MIILTDIKTPIISYLLYFIQVLVGKQQNAVLIGDDVSRQANFNHTAAQYRLQLEHPNLGSS